MWITRHRGGPYGVSVARTTETPYGYVVGLDGVGVQVQAPCVHTLLPDAHAVPSATNAPVSPHEGCPFVHTTCPT